MKKKYFTEEEKIIAKKEYQKKYKKTHKEERKKYDKKYCQNHKENIAIKKKEYYENHKEKTNIYQKEYRNNRLKKDINFRMICYLRSRMYWSIRGNYKSGSAVRDLGCPISEFKTYIESKFQDGMTWENWSKTGWHIDHIIPLDSFNLQNREEFLKACHYTNLQPMWAEENLRKGGKVCRT
jgi:hypothetical protein